MKKSLFVACGLLALTVATPALAQRFELQGIYQRIGRLENDMGLLQRQAATGGMAGGTAVAPAATGQLSAEIMRIDEEIRALRGEIERIGFQNDQLQKQLQKSQEDMEYRIQDLEKKSMNAPMAAITEGAEVAPEAVAENSAPAMAARDDLTEDLTAVVRNQQDVDVEGGEAPLSARDLYNSAFKKLNQTDYEGAEASFRQFTQKYANDPLVGNAWYWLGEAYYVQRDYMKAADSFRQGYTKLPAGPKAGDNLLKLGMTLAALKKTNEACVVLKQADKKFSATSEAIKAKSRQEISRLGCK